MRCHNFRHGPNKVPPLCLQRRGQPGLRLLWRPGESKHYQHNHHDCHHNKIGKIFWTLKYYLQSKVLYTSSHPDIQSHPLLSPLCYIHLILCFTIISLHPCSLVLLRSYCKYTTGSRGNPGKPRHHGQPGHEGRPWSPRPCWRTQPWAEQPDLQVKISKGMCAISTLVSV